MPSCPVCEAAVVVFPCEVCGHTSGLRPEPPGPAPDPLLELEPTRFTPSPAPSREQVLDLVRTSAESSPDVPAGGLEAIDSGREAAADRSAPEPPGPVACRYCQHVQADGLLCDHCGMRLPRRRWDRTPGSAPAPAAAESLIRCRRCGERTYPRERCGRCGGLLAAET